MSAISYSTFERDFRREKTLGKGNCSTVTQVYHLVEQRSYALKLTELDTLDEMTQSFNEVEAVKGIDDDRLAKVTSPKRRSTTTSPIQSGAPTR